jgi:hypothetical protein
MCDARRCHRTGVPCELVTHHDPRRPLLLGGLGQGEEKLGMMRMRLKRHRWFPKLLKCRDPLVFSVGWRRFQSLPVFAGACPCKAEPLEFRESRLAWHGAGRGAASGVRVRS